MMAKNSKTTKLERQIDENLRRVYSDLSEEPLPDRFVQLLDELRKQENSKSDTQSGEDS
ncbi:MAG: RNA polymerase subunit sigma-70 [Rhodobacteraceae bacterium]|nr:MAG: RNA polymerase subunit sigma-70 [Paracoccaceae bacterium]